MTRPTSISPFATAWTTAGVAGTPWAPFAASSFKPTLSGRVAGRAERRDRRLERRVGRRPADARASAVEQAVIVSGRSRTASVFVLYTPPALVPTPPIQSTVARSELGIDLAEGVSAGSAGVGLPRPFSGAPASWEKQIGRCGGALFQECACQLGRVAVAQLHHDQCRVKRSSSGPTSGSPRPVHGHRSPAGGAGRRGAFEPKKPPRRWSRTPYTRTQGRRIVYNPFDGRVIRPWWAVDAVVQARHASDVRVA